MSPPSFPIQHDFALKQLSPNSKPNYQPYVKLSFFFQKRPDISYEDFHRHWETVHADLAVASKAFALNIKRYTQFHALPECKEAGKALVEGMELLDYDGCSEILVSSIGDAAAFFSSSEYVEKMNSDEGNWLARPVRFMIGYDNLIFGQGMPMPKATDGILPKDLEAALQQQ
ncbi:EthD domain-containing protein [Cladophialophora immunda]|nr:EthD domain-containing protein [Cladophialophora immunda]